MVMNLSERTKSILYPSVLLFAVLVTWYVRSQVWFGLESVEIVFALLVSSYVVLLFIAIAFLKKDLHQSVKAMLRTGKNVLFIYGVVLSVLFQVLSVVFCLATGGTVKVVEWFSLEGYENYAVYSLPLAFTLYLTFAIFGAFVEEVTYRGYVQSRVTKEHGALVGIAFSSVIFTLQHFHIFDARWISRFVESQLLHVFLFGLFAAYFFFKTKLSLKGVIAFHIAINIFDVALPVKLSYLYPLAFPATNLLSFAVLFLALKLLTS
jgi:membrane protease YdiL (CAAX protease family)